MPLFMQSMGPHLSQWLEKQDFDFDLGGAGEPPEGIGPDPFDLETSDQEALDQAFAAEFDGEEDLPLDDVRFAEEEDTYAPEFDDFLEEDASAPEFDDLLEEDLDASPFDDALIEEDFHTEFAAMSDELDFEAPDLDDLMTDSADTPDLSGLSAEENESPEDFLTEEIMEEDAEGESLIMDDLGPQADPLPKVTEEQSNRNQQPDRPLRMEGTLTLVDPENVLVEAESLGTVPQPR